MATCPKCGASVEADDEFCPDCGARLSSAMEPKGTALQKERIVVLQQQPKRHRFLTFIIVLLVIIFLIRACASFSSEPQLPYYKPTYTQEVTPDERLVTIPTPAPSVTFPSSSQAESPEKIAERECSGVAAKITDACFSCGVASCGLIVTAANTGSRQIASFKTIAHYDAMNKDESYSIVAIDIGASKQFSVHSDNTNVRMIELVPRLAVGGEFVECKNAVASYGNEYGDIFGECGMYSGGEEVAKCGDGIRQSGETCSNCLADVQCSIGEMCEYGECVPASSGYDATYDAGY